jgi:hypothetical protein
MASSVSNLASSNFKVFRYSLYILADSTKYLYLNPLIAG